ncbi:MULTISPECIES: putative bifunctional diguanylate cyclase/phosphodiesterase [Pseudomonas syringae group]|uniref:cyclic-guanylate-specific phosphodiesterase n=4 Tax=Pseudomonas syringae group TaxID=136849 RepID=A0AA40TWN0_9PSED|nr:MULTISPECIES: bifunctional diguanylate cyclase/phosphodiesterase [Pseudomonas syringae group]KOP51683.1 diguanylate cyclase [Pseudomonas coronafaciens pv. porri]KOP57228.1 diguanylate cyclase [Pseudomonas coronafaciens pv. porri]KPB55516.1 GGDEF domain/EAL domain-containing protein [Pseudomonas coronafaciens pv. oryzae]KPX28634.1 GGDEF domain/EAL domain protein [Pseudomonas coronafaciens pv. garcae]KPY05869.1 GGDEF domain/EAL domain-containing protein [Pseudomonas coronafaciens pv. oryzae]
MPTPVEPLRLLLLAHEPFWQALLNGCVAAPSGNITLLHGANWDVFSARYGDERNTVLLTTPDLQPRTGACLLPTVVLLEEEPLVAPSGVCDWLVRDTLTGDVLRRCLRYVHERSSLEDTLRRLAGQDPLTGIANRQGFQAQLATRLAEGGNLAMGHLDLDNFRRANDSLGHQAGDRLILQVVARLKNQLDAGDQIARLGGDEFALLIDTQATPARALQLAERITDVLAEPYWIDGESLLLGCSLGIAHSQSRLEADPLMWHAHIAMRQAKSIQGCTFHLFDERINRNARSLADLEGELRRALRRDEMELHYQPRLCLSSGRVVGLEALVRWRHQERGLLAPSEFVPLAEQSGLIVPLGYWVILRALRDMQTLREQGFAPLHMAINLSFRQFQDSQLLPTLSRLIEQHSVDARWLEFELTETAIMRRSDQVRQTMEALRRLGVRFSLDDFGTGYSSFMHLNSLPIALLKIDMGFVSQMETREENRKLVNAMINLAHNLNLEVVAEGVETVGQLELLRSFGCDQVQGYLLSRPLPLDELMTYLYSEASHTEALTSA